MILAASIVVSLLGGTVVAWLVVVRRRMFDRWEWWRARRQVRREFPEMFGPGQ